MKNSVFSLEQLTEDPCTHMVQRTLSILKPVNRGVPQGSILPPLNLTLNLGFVCSPLTCCSGTLECPVTSVTPETPETVTLWPEMFAMVTLLRWMYLRKTSAFRLARVQACQHGNRLLSDMSIHRS